MKMVEPTGSGALGRAGWTLSRPRLNYMIPKPGGPEQTFQYHKIQTVVSPYWPGHAGAERYSAPPRVLCTFAEIIRGGAEYRSAPAWHR